MPRKKKTEAEDKQKEEKKEEIKEKKEEKIEKEEVKEEKKEQAEAVTTEIKNKLAGIVEDVHDPIIEELGEKEKLLVPLDYYVKTAVHLGTKVVTPDMREYVYKRRADGIAVLNTKKIDDRIIRAADFLAKYDPEQIVFCCKRDNCEKIVEVFGKTTGMKVFTKYPAGIITNPLLSDFFEPELIFVSDPWIDKNALRDAAVAKLPVVALCSTNNLTRYVDVVVPCNNKTPKSIGLVLYLIAKLFLEKKGIKKQIDLQDFCDIEEKKELDLEEARKLIKKKLAERKAREAEKKE